MKKNFTAIVMLVSILTFGGCAPTPTPTPASVPDAFDSTNASLGSEEEAISEDEQWSDLRRYAKAYIFGDWDGTTIYRTAYEGGVKPYVSMDEGWLRVGDLPPVVPGATLEDVTPDNLVSTYTDAERKAHRWIPLIKADSEHQGWVHLAYGCAVWSADYTSAYEVSKATGEVSRKDSLCDSYTSCVTVVDTQTYDGDALDTSRLVEMFRSGAWDGNRIWCEASQQIATLTDRGINIYEVGNGWNYTRIFPAVGAEPLAGIRAGYYDKGTSITVTIGESGISLYTADGTIITSLDIDEYDAERAFVSSLVEGSDLAFAYGGGNTVYAIDFAKRQVFTYYQNVASVWYNGESSVVVEYDDASGHHVANREHEVLPEEYDTLPAPARPTTKPPLEG